ncbi:hypothetical protein MNAN1_001732 [Malassezia nana]|uniref:Protein Zds1 C-terminal domain-containing protein n=1 Tax=Malassezia nana TaxID=180528 RepID=A0AAF0ER44_9BASI|nr:hypothetical protein MNAN1_001732 [Malassezia nana]
MEGLDVNEWDLQREVQVLRAHRRLSASHPAAIDPDFPGLASPPSPTSADSLDTSLSSSPASSSASASPPGTPEMADEPFDASRFQEASPIFGSSQRQRYLARRQMRLSRAPPGTSQPLPKPSAHAASGPSNELWVSASIHPEVSPSEFRAFLREQAEKNVSLHSAEAVTSQDLAARYLARSASLTRRGSSLRKQVEGDERDTPPPSPEKEALLARSLLLRYPLFPPPTDANHWQRARSIPPRHVRETARSYRKPPPAIPPMLTAAAGPEAPSHYVAPGSLQGRARTLSDSPVAQRAVTPPPPPPPTPSTPPPPPPASTPPPSRQLPRPVRPRPAVSDELKTRPADLRAMLPQKGDLPRLPTEASTPPRSASPERIRRPLPEVRPVPRAEVERHEGTRPLPRVPPEREAPLRRSEEQDARPSRVSDEPVRPSASRDRKTFGLSWFGLSKDDDESKTRRKERERTDEETPPSTPRREKDTFLANLFGKRKGLDTYDLRHRARHLFSSSSGGMASGPVDVRYPFATERALYRLSHVKLSHPRRPLQQQVVISNLMFWYLSVIHSAQTRPMPSSTAERRGLGPSEYDERLQRHQSGTGPVAVHTGTLLRAVPRPGLSPAMLSMYGAPAMPPAWTMAPMVAHTDDAHVPYASHAPPGMPLMRTARGPLPPVPGHAGAEAPRTVRQSHLDEHLDQVKSQALSTQHALRHARSSPSLSRSPSPAPRPLMHRSHAP